MKLLYLVPKEIYDTKMSRVRFHQVEALARLHHVQVHMSGPGWKDWDESISLENRYWNMVGDQGKFDLALAYMVDGLAELPCPLATSFNEAEEHWKVESYIQANNVELAIFHHKNDLQHYKHLEDDGVVLAHIHHCAETSIYKDYGLEKTIDVLVAGNMSQDFYPHRNRLKQIATGILRKRSYVVTVLPHPGYTFPIREGTVVGEDFARLINQSKIAFTCSMKFHYALAKYSEIALCRTLVAGDVPDQNKEFYRGTILELAPWMTDDEIVRRVEGVLDDPELLTKMTTISYDANLKNCTMDVYAQMFCQTAYDFCVAKGYSQP